MAVTEIAYYNVLNQILKISFRDMWKYHSDLSKPDKIVTGPDNKYITRTLLDYLYL